MCSKWVRIVFFCMGPLFGGSMPCCATTLDDIQFWTGAGNHRVGVAIDWDGDDAGGDDAVSLAWGFYWEDSATVEDALRAIVEADPWLFARLSTPEAHGSRGTSVYGLGGDRNANGTFGVAELDPAGIDPPQPVAFDEAGIAETGVPGLYQLDESGDLYREGWLMHGYWNLATTQNAALDTWAGEQVGISNLVLASETWVGLSFTPSFRGNAYPNNIVPAAAPALPGDFNGDGRVNLADYTVWRDNSLPVQQYDLWRENFGMGYDTTTASLATQVPEPSTLLACVMMLGAVRFMLRTCFKIDFLGL